MMSGPTLFLRLFLPFAGAYFLSYLYRTINAVIGPILSEELSLGAADLGLLTSAYFVAFGAVQVPLGMFLDRFGARRAEAVLLICAAVGAAVFACGHSIGALAFGRGLIGLGVSACFMGALKNFSQWFPPEKMASLTGWIMTVGTLGALTTTAPLDLALRITGWREIFLALALVTLLVAAWVFFAALDRPAADEPESLADQWPTIRRILRTRHFWRIAPVSFAQIGGFMAVQSLWSTAWLIRVNGYSRSAAAEHLAAMSLAMLVAYALIGLAATRLARRGIGPLALLGGGMFMALLSLLAIICEVSAHHYPLWIAYGAFSSFGTLCFASVSKGFPAHLAGRVNTLCNLMSFIGGFIFQWGIGLLIDHLLACGYSQVSAHRRAFAALLVIQAAAWLWLVFGGRSKSTKPGMNAPSALAGPETGRKTPP